jgi:hypothetical protein
MLNPADFLQLDARQIGYQCGTSEATVVRFCQRTGYRGLSEMKKILALELATALTASQSASRPEGQDIFAERVFADCVVALKDTLSCIDPARMESAATAIARSGIAPSVWRGRLCPHRSGSRAQISFSRISDPCVCRPNAAACRREDRNPQRCGHRRDLFR